MCRLKNYEILFDINSIDEGNGDFSDSSVSGLRQWAFDSYFYNSSDNPCALHASFQFRSHSTRLNQKKAFCDLRQRIIFIRLRYIRKRSFDIDWKLISLTRINFFQLCCHRVFGSDSVNDSWCCIHAIPGGKLSFQMKRMKRYPTCIFFFIDQVKDFSMLAKIPFSRVSHSSSITQDFQQVHLWIRNPFSFRLYINTIICWKRCQAEQRYSFRKTHFNAMSWSDPNRICCFSFGLLRIAFFTTKVNHVGQCANDHD